MELKITTHANDLFLFPTYNHHQPNPSSDIPEHDSDPAVLLVFIQLSIPQNYTPPSKLSSLTVSLTGYESIGFPRGGFEQNQPYHSKRTIPSATDLKLEPGCVYQFECPFLVDHNTAPYQRSKYGRHHQKLTAKASFPGLFTKSLTAEKNVFFVESMAQSGSLSYYHVHRNAVECLGPIFFGVRSQHLTVGGYLRTTFSLASPSPTLKLHALRLSLLQQTTLKSRLRPGYAESPPLEKFTFFQVGEEELKRCILTEEELLLNNSVDSTRDSEPGEGNWVARLPNDSAARGSSLPGSNSAIKIAHALELAIDYIDPCSPAGDGVIQTYTTSWNLILPSCACRWHSMRLPSYTPQDSSPVPAMQRDEWGGKNEHESHSQCVCGERLEALLEMEEEARKAREPQASSEIWRQMLESRREARRERSRNASRSHSASPSVSRGVSRRNSFEGGDHAEAAGSDGDRLANDGSGIVQRRGRSRARERITSRLVEGETFQPEHDLTGRAGGDSPTDHTPPTPSEQDQRGGGTSPGTRSREDAWIDDRISADNLTDFDFDLEARDLLEGLDGDTRQREWDRILEERNRRLKERNEYVNLRSSSLGPTRS
ncbi:hypothetical protein IE53DRAFT_387880 [Violaceomyces palustris]|uniref:Uncharacterized protein n=1 Tax=Violaceomyces palustris TaxID=1673888 RepID=A0ACD0NVW7_9BASI|nr:hypothetical protein IE53DRAFT_387880 [Violaceomyces palustris]